MRSIGKAVCFVGPMLGSHNSWVPSPAELLASHLEQEGIPTMLTSQWRSPVPRLFDTIWSMIRWTSRVEVFVVFVYSGQAFANADIASLVAKILGKPLILALHGGNLPDFKNRHPTWVGRVMKRSDVLVAPTSFLAGMAPPGKQIACIPNVLYLHDYPFNERSNIRPKLLWMRTFASIYNPLMAIEALRHVLTKYPSATLTMAGQDKGLLAATRAHAVDLGIADRVRFPGFLSPDAKRQEFRDHDIFLNTNHVDNAPVSVLEAAASGLPVVATSVGGIPHLLQHGESALLVQDDDAEAMSGAIDLLLTDPDLTSAISSAGRNLASQSAWSEVRKQWLEILRLVSSGEAS